VEVKRFSPDGEREVLAKTEGRQPNRSPSGARNGRASGASCAAGARACRNAIHCCAAERGQKEAGRAFGWLRIGLPGKDEEVTREARTFPTDKSGSRRPNCATVPFCCSPTWSRKNPALYCDRYLQWRQSEAAFPCLHSEWGHPPDLLSWSIVWRPTCW